MRPITPAHIAVPVILFLSAFLLFSIALPVQADTRDLLSPEEELWLKSRNNTIVVYPEENFPPYSYKNSAGNPQGLGVDYLELIAEKIGAKLEYLTARPRSQMMVDIKNGKGDVVTAITPDDEKNEFLVFTGNYLSSPAVIVVRKDYQRGDNLNLNDFNGKRISVVDGSALERYVRTNYPRVVIDEMTDDEVGLQQVVLGEVDAAVMDVASLSFFLSKQVLSSVKIAGNTGFEYKPSFGVPKNIVILQSILEKGLTQVSITDRQILADKWIVVPFEAPQENSWFGKMTESFGSGFVYALLGAGIVGIIILIRRRRSLGWGYLKKHDSVEELKAELSGLERVNNMIAEELKEVKREEDKIHSKIESLEK